MTVTKEQIITIHVLLPERIKRDAEAKEELLMAMTGNPEIRSTTKLTFDEANDLIASLGGKRHSYDHWAIFDRNNDQHRYIMSLMIQVGWSNYEVNLGRHLADMKHLSEFLKSEKSPCQKKLKDMNVLETSRVIRALEGILKHNLK